MRLRPVLALAGLTACSSGPVVNIAAPPPGQELEVSAPSEPLAVRAVAQPAAGAVDGQLGEWGAPSVTLSGGVRAWIAFGATDVRVAVEATAPIDEVHLSLSFPLPEVPEIAFRNQFGEQLVDSDDACDTLVAESDPTGDAKACKAWRRAAVEHRAKLAERFRRTFVLGPKGVTALKAGAPEPVAAKVAAAGRVLEASLPLEALPLTGQYPLAKGEAGLEVRSAGHRHLSAPDLRASDPKTFGPLAFDAPVAFGPSPRLLGAAFKASDAAEGVGCFVQPGARVTAASCLLNRAEGYQFMPSRPSPEEVELDVSKAVELQRTPTGVLWHTPLRVDEGFGTGWALAVEEGGFVAWTHEVQGAQVVARGPEEGGGQRFLLVEEGLQSPLGTGMCGACPRLDVSWVRVDAALRLVGEGSLESFYSRSGETLELVKGATAGAFTIFWGDDGDTQGERRVTYRWSDKDHLFREEEAPVAPIKGKKDDKKKDKKKPAEKKADKKAPEKKPKK